MLGQKCRDQLELFVTGSLQQLVPEDRVLARVDRKRHADPIPRSGLRESRTPGSVRAKAEWLSYSTTIQPRAGGGNIATCFAHHPCTAVPALYPAAVGREAPTANFSTAIHIVYLGMIG